MEFIQVSSEELQNALRRLGFEPRKASGSHQVWKRPGGGRCTITLGKKVVSRTVMKDVLANGRITEDELLVALKRKKP